MKAQYWEMCFLISDELLSQFFHFERCRTRFFEIVRSCLSKMILLSLLSQFFHFEHCRTRLFEIVLSSSESPSRETIIKSTDVSRHKQLLTIITWTDAVGLVEGSREVTGILKSYGISHFRDVSFCISKEGLSLL